MEYFSQLQQDKFVDDILKQKTDGFFIDIGAHDGVSCSNTLFFERFRNWNGICIEPASVEFKKLVENRRSTNINACVSDYNGESEFTYVDGYAMMLSGLTERFNQMHINRINDEVKMHGGSINRIMCPVITLQSIFEKHSIYDVDYCSIDTEGSELQIVKSIDFDKTNIKVFSIENNYQETDIQHFLESKGYKLTIKLAWDDIYVKI